MAQNEVGESRDFSHAYGKFNWKKMEGPEGFVSSREDSVSRAL